MNGTCINVVYIDFYNYIIYNILNEKDYFILYVFDWM